jgi:hypothetical protein
VAATSSTPIADAMAELNRLAAERRAETGKPFAV